MTTEPSQIPHSNAKQSTDSIRTDSGTPPSGYDGERPSDKHENEIFDVILHNEPIKFRDIMDQISTYSADDVMTHLSSLEQNGFIEEREVKQEHGSVTITNDMWCTTEITNAK
jgi:hypothetical protein